MITKLKRRDYVINAHLQFAWHRSSMERRDAALMVQREERIFALVCTADPAGGRYLAWLSRWRRRQWDAVGVGSPCSLHELEGLTEALAAYEQARRSLPPKYRDVGQLLTVEDLMIAAASQKRIGRRSAGLRFKSEALRGSVRLFMDPQWSLIRLNTEAAARWWGMGTKWCTAARDGNQFARYASAGELLVLLTPTGRYQYFRPTGEFMDARDEPANLNEVLDMAPNSLKAILL